MGPRLAIAIEAYFRYDGRAACNSVSQSRATGRLQSDLRHKRNYTRGSEFCRHSGVALLRLQQFADATDRAWRSDGLKPRQDPARGARRSRENKRNSISGNARVLSGIL